MKIKLKRRDTGQTFKQWIISQDKKGMPGLNEDGMPFYVDFTDFYFNYEMLNRKDWIIEVATKKEDDKWIYEQIGY